MSVELMDRLYDKMMEEQKVWKEWLINQSREEILNHSYEYNIRNDIILAMEDSSFELTYEQASALLKLPDPLMAVYRHFEKLETDHMEVIRDSIENKAKDLCRN